MLTNECPCQVSLTRLNLRLIKYKNCKPFYQGRHSLFLLFLGRVINNLIRLSGNSIGLNPEDSVQYEKEQDRSMTLACNLHGQNVLNLHLDPAQCPPIAVAVAVTVAVANWPTFWCREKLVSPAFQCIDFA